MNYIIAIDGHSSCGKSTLAKDLAGALSFTYVDTGAMYRAVTLLALRKNLIVNNLVVIDMLEQVLETLYIDFKYNAEKRTAETFLNGENVEDFIRTIQVSNSVSIVSSLEFVRTKLVAMQQQLGKNKSVVMDGRDIGTVVFPNATLKIFLTATPEVRAKRRFDELKAKGDNVTYEQVFTNVLERDKIDSTREINPLRQATDAILIDNSNITIAEQFNLVLDLFNKKILK